MVYLLCALNAFSIIVEIMFPAIEFPSATYHSLEIPDAPSENQHLEGRKPVEKESYAHDMMQFAVRQVLIEHRKIVSEVEKSLPWVALWQCSASEVVSRTVSDAVYLSA